MNSLFRERNHFARGSGMRGSAVAKEVIAMWSQFKETRQRSRANRLAQRAQKLRAMGRHEEALPVQEELLKIARDLALAYPDELIHVPDELYNLASSLRATGRLDAAIEMLEESERKYLELAAWGRQGVDALVADVRARKGLTQSARGYGVSAVMDLDAAVTAYSRLYTGADDPRYLDLARVLAMNAEVLRRHGDPDLAVTSADSAMSLYASRIRTIDSFWDAAMHWDCLSTAASVSSEIHAAHGGIKEALTADIFAVHAARFRTSYSKTTLDLRALALALTRHGLHLKANNQDSEAQPLLLEGAVLDSASASEASTQWELAKTGKSPVLITLATSLDAAASVLGSDRVPDRLSANLTRPGSRAFLKTPSDRCDPQLAPAFAQELSEISTALLPTMRAEGMRLGLEAHFLFAISSRMQTPSMRYQLQTFGPPWARVLLACSRAYETQGNLSMALDLASWCGGVTTSLMPFSVLDTTLSALILECVEHHARLLIASGDKAAGDELLDLARPLRPQAGSVVDEKTEL
jgi:tetratricopeptide (TPR) repeat protein